MNTIRFIRKSQSNYKFGNLLKKNYLKPCEVDSIRLAVFTVSPNKQKRGILRPTTPVTLYI
jgi:hypothetical protein